MTTTEATPAQQKQKKKVVVVGGGWAGFGAAKVSPPMLPVLRYLESRKLSTVRRDTFYPRDIVFFSAGRVPQATTSGSSGRPSRRLPCFRLVTRQSYVKRKLSGARLGVEDVRPAG